MAEGNGRIINPNAPPMARSVFTRDQRKEIDRIVHEAVIQECAKVHEHYLVQIPKYTATMIQDALMSYGLIVLPEGTKEELDAVARQAATAEGAGTVATAAPDGNADTVVLGDMESAIRPDPAA